MEFTNEKVRRQDRTMNETRALEILAQGEYGVLSMRTEDGNGAYGVPLSYVWDKKSSLYIHCAPEGRKLRCIDACGEVSFCVVGRTNVVPEKFTTGYESIVMSGVARHDLSADERRFAMELFVEKYCPQLREQGKMAAEKSFHRTEVIRLEIQKISGKTKPLFGEPGN